MRVAIASRIFEPEPSAASFRLAALAEAFVRSGDDVTVLTVRPSRGAVGIGTDSARQYRVSRFPVLRDKTGYVRGYVQYLSFDVPLFFRLLVRRRTDLTVVEPPPTTGFFVRLASRLRKRPYVYYAADVWSDAAASTGAPAPVVRFVRWMERFALAGAQTVLSVNSGVTERIKAMVPNAHVRTVGNGVDTRVFTIDGPSDTSTPCLLYSGTASEWQGAGIFIEAFARLQQEHPDLRLIFLGQGSDWPELQRLAARLPTGRVTFVPTVPPSEAAMWMRGAVASLASIRPDAEYGFAFPTKVFASWASGTPVIFAGEGLVREYMAERSERSALGWDCAYDLDAVELAMRDVLGRTYDDAQRRALAEWARGNVGLQAVAESAVHVIHDQEKLGAA